MHSCDTLPAPATGTNLLLQLGRLIIRSRSASPARGSPQDPHDALLQAKLRAAKPHTSRQIPYQFPPKLDPERPVLEAKLDDHFQALWNEHIPVCIEVFLAPDCAECHSSFVRENEDRPSRALLLERWTMQALVCKNHESRAFITSQWLLNAVRSQLHFSQLAAWLARLKTEQDDSNERRRKLSREKCNYKKLEANCDDDLSERKLHIVYSIKIPGETYKMAEFSRTPTDHTFPVTDIGNNVYLKVVLQSLPRIDDIPTLKCLCKRRASKDMSNQEELVAKLNDLTLGTRPKFPEDSINSNIGNSSRRLSIVSNSGSTEYLFTSAPDKKDRLLDDRMHTTCSENGKHKCNCDDESDGKENQRSSTSVVKQDKLKEMAKHKRRMRKEYKFKQSDSTSSEGDVHKKEYTSIPILQAAKFDRFRAIGYYRNQTYLTLPASRIEVKTPFEPALPPVEFKKTNSVSTQTEDFLCNCGNPLDLKCGDCKGMVRSEANYNLASLNGAELNASDEQKTENGARRKSEENGNSHKKQKCDNINKENCDISLDNVNSIIEGRGDEEIIKKPKLRRFFLVEDRIGRVVSDRNTPKDHDVEELNLKMDDTVFSEVKRPIDSFSEVKRQDDNFSEAKKEDDNFSEGKKPDDDFSEMKRPNQDVKRQKTFSVSDEDYILYEKCDYGTIDRCDMESPKDDHPPDMNGFQFPDPEVNKTPPEESPPQMGFPWTLDPSSSMVFTKTGLPLNSSPAPLRKGSNCFDFDKSISSVSGIRSALFQPISTPGPTAPPAETKENIPRSITPRPTRPRVNRPKHTALLGSFEESCLKGRLDPVATVEGFTAEIGASGSFCPPHKRFPVTVYFFAPGGTNAPYMGHVALPGGYRVPRAGSVQLALFNPAGALVRVWVVRHDLRRLPPRANTFLRQRTLRAAPGEDPSPAALRYLIHLRFMTSKSGKLYLHTDIRIIVSRKADFDTATAHCAIYRPVTTNQKSESADNSNGVGVSANGNAAKRAPNRVFGGCGDADSSGLTDIGFENDNVAYELKSFTYAPDNPKYSPR